MPSRAERNEMFNTTEIFDPLGGRRERVLWVSSTSTGSVDLETLVVIDGVETWENVETYTAGTGDTIQQGRCTLRIVPSDDTTYYKF